MILILVLKFYEYFLNRDINYLFIYKLKIILKL